MMKNGKPDMNDIKKALAEEDYCEAMELIGYKIMFYDEYGFYCVFKNDTLTSLVYFDAEDKEFWTYTRTNHAVIDEVSEHD